MRFSRSLIVLSLGAAAAVWAADLPTTIAEAIALGDFDRMLVEVTNNSIYRPYRFPNRKRFIRR